MTMNIFRLAGDLSHLLSFFFLIHRLLQKRTSQGLSLKTQELYLLVFVTRYLDLFTTLHSVYNTVMKIIYIGGACGCRGWRAGGGGRWRWGVWWCHRWGVWRCHCWQVWPRGGGGGGGGGG